MYTDEDAYSPAPTLGDAHNQWHSVHGWDMTCPLDCGASESYYDPEPFAILVYKIDEFRSGRRKVYSGNEMRTEAASLAKSTGRAVKIELVK